MSPPIYFFNFIRNQASGLFLILEKKKKNRIEIFFPIKTKASDLVLKVS